MLPCFLYEKLPFLARKRQLKEMRLKKAGEH